MILNLTQHQATPDQKGDGVVDLPGELRQELCSLLTFNSLGETREMEARAEAVLTLVLQVAPAAGTKVMLGGAPAFMPVLENVLKNAGLLPMYSFSVRDSVETVNPDGSVTKRQVFRHAGWWNC